MGTSLKVHGLKKLVKDFAKVVHATGTGPNGTPKVKKSWQGKVIFVNKTPPGSEWSDVIDYHVAGETDEWVERVLEDWKKMRPSDWEVQQTLDKTSESGGFKVVKDAVTKMKGKGEGELDYRFKCAAHFHSILGASKRNPDVENVDPFLSQPALSSKKPVSSAPSSPSKRRQSASHYSDVESSPRKRRDIAKIADDMEKMDMSGRRRLFTDATNAIKNAGGEDLVMGELELAKAKASTAAVSKEGNPRSRSVAKSRRAVWVEIMQKA